MPARKRARMRCSRLALTSCRQGLSSRPRRRRGTRDKVRGGEERLLKTHLGGRGGGGGGLPQSCAPFPVGLWEPGGMQAGWSSRDGASRELRGEGREAQSAESSHPQCPPPTPCPCTPPGLGSSPRAPGSQREAGGQGRGFRPLCVCGGEPSAATGPGARAAQLGGATGPPGAPRQGQACPQQ